MTVSERERVLALAPDPGSRIAAATLASSSAWSDTGRSSDAGPRVLWGQCRGSGSRPYLTAVVLDEAPAYSCTCPSRKFPCKHALALVLRDVAAPLTAGEPPPYAAEWLRRRADRSDRPATEPRPPGELADPDGAAKRAALRAERVAGGLDELDRWLHDQIRGGLAGLERAGYGPFETIAARMVDAQAPGVASLLRSLPGEIAGEGWPARLLDQFGLLHLLIQAHRSLDRLEPGLASTVRSRIGYPVAKDDVISRPGALDHWLALGVVDTVEYRLESRRVWLYGAESERWAMLLSFAPPGGFLPAEAEAGDQLHARLHFYPGSGQVRALVGARTSTTKPPSYPVGRSLAVIQQHFAGLLAADPWATRMPCALAAAPIRGDRTTDSWRLRDAEGATCDIVGLMDDPWLLLACSGGDPINLFGEWSPRGFRPLSVLPGDRGVGFSTVALGPDHHRPAA